MYFVGIDNGFQGAIAVIDDSLKINNILKYPRDNIKVIYDFLNPYAIYGHVFAVIEKPFRNPQIGMEKTFQIFGQYEMAFKSLGIKFETAEPRLNMRDSWRKEFNFKSKDTKSLKHESVEMCNMLFDGRSDVWLRQQKKNIKSRVEYTLPDDNISDALLLALYAQRIYCK